MNASTSDGEFRRVTKFTQLQRPTPSFLHTADTHAKALTGDKGHAQIRFGAEGGISQGLTGNSRAFGSAIGLLP